MRNRIVYITPVVVPSSSAASKRILSNAILLTKLNYDITICSGETKMKAPFYLDKVLIFPTFETNLSRSKVQKIVAYPKAIRNCIAYLNQEENNLKAVFIYSGYTPYIISLMLWAKGKKIPLVFDAVEWYTPLSKLYYLFNPYFWSIEFSMRFLLPKLKNVMAISSFLNKYYSDKQCSTVILPPLFSSQYGVNGVVLAEVVKISYTGSPGKKDLLNKVVEAVYKFNRHGEKMVLQVAGISKEKFLELEFCAMNKIVEMPKCFEVFGVVSNEEAIEITRKSNFSILLRENTKTNNAGFPTKVVESLSLGTPVILNYTSDLKLYLKDNFNSFVCEDIEIQTLMAIFEKVLTMSNTVYTEMRVNALKTAMENFHISSQENKVNDFLNKLKV